MTKKKVKQAKKKKPAVKKQPKQALFLAYYFNPKSETYGNAYRSAIKAGYKDKYARNITHLAPDWLSEIIGKNGKKTNRMLQKAERNLDEFLDTEDIKVRLDASKFIAERLGRKKYSTRQEVETPSLEKIIEKANKYVND